MDSKIPRCDVAGFSWALSAWDTGLACMYMVNWVKFATRIGVCWSTHTKRTVHRRSAILQSSAGKLFVQKGEIGVGFQCLGELK